ncbi:hypothetical protein [Dongia sp.]|uniref:hypothetical protein n=1 Tax=Dongia sp. TaxID=1977262 RepID=UPI0035AFE8D6
MRHVIVAPPTIDIRAQVAELVKKTGSTLLADPSRGACERYGYQTLYEMPVALQKSTRTKLITDHVASLRSHKAVVADHSVFIWLADWMRWLWGETPSEEWEAVLALAGQAVPLYDRIEHVTAGPAAGYDGYHWLDQRNGAQIERLIRHLYVDFGCLERVSGLERGRS